MTLKTHHLLSGAVALSILTTTTGLWAQSTATSTPTTPMAPTASTSPAPATAKSLIEAFGKADANKDLKLTRTEAKDVPGLEVNFAATDTNKDGMVSKDELQKALQ